MARTATASREKPPVVQSTGERSKLINACVSAKIVLKTSLHIPVESARSAEGVRSHLAPAEPIANVEPSRKTDKLTDAVDRVASRTPDAGVLRVRVCWMEAGKAARHASGRGRW